MNYHNWDYSYNSWIPTQTNKDISQLLLNSDTTQSSEYIHWLHMNHQDFAFSFREFIFPRIIEFKHFSLADDLLDKKLYYFDEKIAKSCAFKISISFEEDVFNYWNAHVIKMNPHDQSSVYKKFWEEFLSYQFQRSEEFNNNLPHLSYIFDKVPFYINSNYDLLNSYLIKSREGFFKKLSTLEKDSQFILLQQLSILCGQNYPESKAAFKEEFQHFPELLEIFDKTVFYEKLNHSLQPKHFTKKVKI